ncbi:MAG: hypothetical protein ACREQC_01010, partial [Candidatus Binataceae bacterium]
VRDCDQVLVCRLMNGKITYDTGFSRTLAGCGKTHRLSFRVAEGGEESAVFRAFRKKHVPRFARNDP